MRRSKSRRNFTFPILLTIGLVLVAGFFVYQMAGSPKETEEAAKDSEVQSSQSNEKKDSTENVNPATEEEKETKEEKEGKTSVSFFDQNVNIEEKVNHLVSTMTLKEKIGQLMVVGFNSSEVDQHIRTMINDYKVGGVILFDRNMNSPKQVAELNNALQDLALENDHEIPLHISVDQEGGPVMRMKDGVTPIPSQQELGKQNDGNKVYNTAGLTGKELAAMGFTVNYAPVLDLSSTDRRSFGEDPEKVAVLGNKVVTGLNDSDITATLKHFPGNGRSEIDPHIETSSVETDTWDLEASDIYPFKKIIDSVDHQNFFVMVTHIKYPAYDKENPASISPVIINDLLRDQLGYSGLVVTDDLEMGAVNKYFTYEDLGYRAVEAGVDVLLVCHTFENQQKVFNGILEAVETNKLSEERIDQSVKRILTNKLIQIPETAVDPVQAEKVVGQ